MSEPWTGSLLSASASIGLAVFLLLAALFLTVEKSFQQSTSWQVDSRHKYVWLALFAQILDPLIPMSVRSFVQRCIDRAGLQPPVSVSLLLLISLVLASTATLFFYWLSTGEGTFSYPGLPVSVLIVALSAWLPWDWLYRRLVRRRLAFIRDLPLMLDLISMSVSQGAPLLVAVEHAVEHIRAGPLRDEFIWLLRDMRAGRSREQALSSMRDRCPIDAMRDSIAAMINSEKQGTDLSQLLCSQAAQRREERFSDAERRAMQTPVKLLLPLLVFIFPGTFLILMYPVAYRLLSVGLI